MPIARVHSSFLFASWASCLVAATASAQEAPAPPAGAPAAEPAAAAAGARVHDGFYLRLGAGYGPLNTKETVDGSSGELKLKGSGMAYDLTIGGTPFRGVVIGGSLFTHAVKPTIEAGGTSIEAQKTIFLMSLGPQVDAYLDPKSGFHFGGGVGWGTLNAVNYTSTGTALHLLAGYDFWIGDNWSAGPMLRLTSSKTSKAPVNDATTSIAILFTVLDH